MNPKDFALALLAGLLSCLAACKQEEIDVAARRQGFSLNLAGERVPPSAIDLEFLSDLTPADLEFIRSQCRLEVSRFYDSPRIYVVGVPSGYKNEKLAKVLARCRATQSDLERANESWWNANEQSLEKQEEAAMQNPKLIRARMEF